MPHSNANGRNLKVAKPRPDFPLFPHANGRWAKKVKGKFAYFGKWADDPKGQAALNLWLDQKDDLLSGRTPRAKRDGLTVRDMCNHFLTAKEQQRDAGELAPISFNGYFKICKLLVDSFGKNRLVVDLASDDFQSLRSSLAKRYAPTRLCTEIQQIRTVLKHTYETGLIDQPVRVGPTFKRPKKKVLRIHKQNSGKKLFAVEDLRAVIKAANQPMRAIIVLAINCGFGNNDCGTLPKSALDLEKGWIDFPRKKTAVERRCPLWPETIAELQEAIAMRPAPALPEHEGLVFITQYGHPFVKESGDSPIGPALRRLLKKLHLYRPGLSFYALRHTFATMAGECCDQVAVNHIMGHADSSMAGNYREGISDGRLQDASNAVRSWLFGEVAGDE